MVKQVPVVQVLVLLCLIQSCEDTFICYCKIGRICLSICLVNNLQIMTNISYFSAVLDVLLVRLSFS